MKSTWPTQELCVGHPMQPIFHWLALGFCIGGNANFRFGVGGNTNFRVFRSQHVGVSNAKLWRWGCKPTPGPNANGFSLQWNIGLDVFRHLCALVRLLLMSLSLWFVQYVYLCALVRLLLMSPSLWFV